MNGELQEHTRRDICARVREGVKAVIEEETTDHLGAAPGEQTDERRGYRNGSYERKLTMRVGGSAP